MEKIENPSKYLGNEYIYLKKVLEGDSWSATGGSWTKHLETEAARLFNTKYAIAFNSGTSTLHAALEACGVGYGDEVISPALTVIMNTTATIHASAVPVYCDIDEKTFLMSPEDFYRKITPKTKALFAVSLYGLSPEYDEIIKIAMNHNICIIEDNAQAVLSYYKGRMLGTIGAMSSFSFENSKHISCGEGGMILTNNEKYAENVRKVGGHGFKNLRAEEGRIRLNQEVFQDPDYKRHDILGWNYRMNEFSAAVALAQLERVVELVDLRKKSAELFIDVMKSCDYLIPQYTPDYSVNSYYTLGVVYEGMDSIGISWQDFRRKYVELGGDGFYGAWSVPYLEPVITDRIFARRLPELYKDAQYGHGLCPVAEKIQKKIMQFKTNYRDVKIADHKASILNDVIQFFKLRGKK